jgi:hypothetical protein
LQPIIDYCISSGCALERVLVFWRPIHHGADGVEAAATIAIPSEPHQLSVIVSDESTTNVVPVRQGSSLALFAQPDVLTKNSIPLLLQAVVIILFLP